MPEQTDELEGAWPLADTARPDQAYKEPDAGETSRGHAWLPGTDPGARIAAGYLRAARDRGPLPAAIRDRLTKEQRSDLDLERIRELEAAIDRALENLED